MAHANRHVLACYHLFSAFLTSFTILAAADVATVMMGLPHHDENAPRFNCFALLGVEHVGVILNDSDSSEVFMVM